MQDQDRPLRVAEATKPSFELIAVGELRRTIGLGRFDRHDGELRAPPAPVAPDVGARANEQSVQPGIEPLDVAQRRQVPPGSNQCVLGGILREFGVAQDEASDPVQPIDGATGQDAEGLMVSASRPVDECRLHVSLQVRGDRSGRLYATAEHKAARFKLRRGATNRAARLRVHCRSPCDAIHHPHRAASRGGLSSTGRASDCGSEGYGFEPRRPPQLPNESGRGDPLDPPCPRPPHKSATTRRTRCFSARGPSA